jgi:hypothetical protein
MQRPLSEVTLLADAVTMIEDVDPLRAAVLSLLARYIKRECDALMAARNELWCILQPVWTGQPDE